MSASLRIQGRNYSFFNKISIDLKYASSASTFSFEAQFNPNNSLDRFLFRPLAYANVGINSSLGERLITGTILQNNFQRSSEQRLATLSGYSSTGVLSDSAFPIESYPLHFTNVTYRELVLRAISFFDPNINFVVENDDGFADEIIEEITATTTITVYKFLSEVAAQRNLFLTGDSFGNLLLTRTNINSNPITHFQQSTPSTTISLNVNGQGIHSDITAMKQPDVENDNVSQSTIRNSLVSAIRPITVQQNVGNDVTVEQVARNVLAKELRNIRLTINTDRWTWLRNGTLETMRPNNVVSVTSPDNFIFERTNFFVESVRLNLDNNKETATLTCVPVEVYNNQVPTQLF